MESERRWYRTQVIANLIVAGFAGVTSWVGCQQYLILKETNRPSLTAVFNVDREVPPQVGQKLGAMLMLSNTGKTFALGYFKGTIVYSLQRMKAPLLPGAETRVLVWPGLPGIEKIEGLSELTEGQLNDMKGGQGYIYIRAYIRYGQNNQYHTAVCTERKLRPAPDGAPSIVWEPIGICEDPEATSAS
jgi:hypothetical protein